MIDDIIRRVIAEVRPYTVVPDAGLATTIDLTLDAISRGVQGDLVECGVWRGGASFAMLLAQRYAFGEIRRRVHMYDSFEGMGEPSPEDGEHAAAWKRHSVSGEPDPLSENWCAATVEEVREAAARLGLVHHVQIWKGWYDRILPYLNAKPERIAVLRVDCDWYAPCKLVYDELAPLVSIGGPIIVDDYDAWEGCRRATQEYLDRHDGQLVRPGHGAYVIREKQ